MIKCIKRQTSTRTETIFTFNDRQLAKAILLWAGGPDFSLEECTQVLKACSIRHTRNNTVTPDTIMCRSRSWFGGLAGA